MSLCLIPILELPGFELPRRERLHPPLLPPSRWPVAEARSLLDLGLHRARHDPAPGLARRRADHINEFRLVGHGLLLARRLASAGLACSQLLNDLLRQWFEVEGRAL